MHDHLARVTRPTQRERTRAGLAPTEAQVLRAICDYLDAEKIRYHRLNSGRILLTGANGKKRMLRGQPAGTPDLLALVPWRQCLMCAQAVRRGARCCGVVVPRHAPVYIEVKALGGRLSDEQYEYLSALGRDGIRCVVAYGADDVEYAVKAVQ